MKQDAPGREAFGHGGLTKQRVPSLGSTRLSICSQRVTHTPIREMEGQQYHSGSNQDSAAEDYSPTDDT